MRMLWGAIAVVVGLPIVVFLYLVVRGSFRRDDEEPAQGRMMRKRTERGHCCVCDYRIGSDDFETCPECGTTDPLWRKRDDPLWRKWSGKKPS